MYTVIISNKMSGVSCTYSDVTLSQSIVKPVSSTYFKSMSAVPFSPRNAPVHSLRAVSLAIGKCLPCASINVSLSSSTMLKVSSVVSKLMVYSSMVLVIF